MAGHRQRANCGNGFAERRGETRGTERMDMDQAERLRTGTGFVADLDQSGGSTPKALGLYGIGKDAYSGQRQMFDLVHQMRTRIITSPAFDGDRVIGAVLFEDTMDRDIEGVRTAEYLRTVKGIVPFLKIDRGLAAETDGAQLMKPIPDLDATAGPRRGEQMLRHEDALVHPSPRCWPDPGPRPTVHPRPADPACRSGSHRRARCGHPQPPQDRGGKATPHEYPHRTGAAGPGPGNHP